MDAFVTRKQKKRKTSTSDGTAEESYEESTDIKLAILASLHPEAEQEMLLDILLAHDGDVQAASKMLKSPSTPRPVKKTTNSTIAGQTSLRSFTIDPSSGEPSSKKPKLLSKKGQTLYLYDPQDISEHTPCSIIHNFLPAEEANELLSELLEEAKTFQKASFKLFDNIVSSPHTSGFYVGSQKELQEQKDDYHYNGGRIVDVRTLTPKLEAIRTRVQETVNSAIQERIRTHHGGQKPKYQPSEPWCANAAFVNCYNGPQESVGWHTDQLTYLGPRPTIASLSLGVTREFRLRRISSFLSSSSSNPDPNLTGQISLPLPHNSLLIMHSTTQEEWKHSVAPTATITPHPIAKNIRINITYRHYRSQFHPKYTPKCHCGVPGVLRVVTNDAKANGERERKENWGRYFYMCHAGNVPDPSRTKCYWFLWGDFDEDGNPKDTGQANQTKPG
ncbi:putative alpha-ketoglutarate-dependent dioxygenase [Triangularia verruculosa]|uniref:Alpha-ketoglutarate-dependent dioxygenase n=1 Tax=Triangularia verruculosa TaxID=2587418 RepID=A0AAN6XD51_9PEZI|nr:putative alpha-ketoglutarate-dependent dioxygenase [Triangularia verruculosa]